MDLLLYPSILAFILLLIISYIVRSRFMRDGLAVTAAGSLVMAIGIFVLYVMPALPHFLSLLTPFVGLELLIIWIFITASYVQCYVRHYFHIHQKSLLNRFNIGTWVVSCALVALILLEYFPEWAEIAWPIAFLALIIYVPYINKAIDDLLDIFKSRIRIQLNGNILLPTVSTQSIVLLINRLWPQVIPFEVNLTLILIALFFYLCCIVLLIRSYKNMQLQNRILDFGHANCMMYGALATIGLVSIETNTLVEMCVNIMWFSNFILFICVEIISVLRFFLRWQKNIFVQNTFLYDVSQWTRNFSYGAFYGFTVAIQPTFNYLPFKKIVDLIAEYGQYIVLLLLIIQIGLFLRAKIRYHALKQVSSFQ